MDENFAWLCTQAVAGADDDHRPGDDKEKVNRFGCIVLDIEADSDCYVLIEGDNTIGRHPLNSIYIEHPSVSMNHAVIQCDSDGVVLVDKGSLNKTRLNKKNLKKEVAYFLDENTSLMFGEVRANYYVDEKPSQNCNASNNSTEQKTSENGEVSSRKFSNKVITTNYSTEKHVKYNTLVINGNNSSCKMETVIPQTVIGSDSIKNTSNDVHQELNSSSPSDELLLEAISQIETMENDIHPSRMIHNVSREDTPSPVMVLNESSLKPKNTLNFTNDIVPREREIVSVIGLNESSNKVNPEVAREDTPSPLMDLECPLLDQHTNPNKIPINLLLSPNKINTDLTREDTPSPVMDLELNGYSSNSLSTSQTNKVNFEETQVSEVNSNIVDTATHCPSTKNISNTNSTVSKPTSLINLCNTNESDSLDECTQLPVWDHKDILSSKKVNSSISINFDDGSLKEEQKNNATFMKILPIQSNDDDIFNCPTQKIIPSNTGVFGAKSSLISFESETNNCKFNDLETQIINLDDHSSHKSLTSKLGRNSVSKNEKLSDSIFEADDDDILFCVAQEVESGEQSDKNLIDISNVKHFDLKHNTNSNFKSKDSFCSKDVLNNDSTSYRPSQILSISKSSHIKSESDVHKQSSLKRNINTFEADDDDIFSSFIQQESNFQVHGLTSLNDENVLNCPTQSKSILNNVNLKTKASFTIHEKETQLILEHPQSATNNSLTSTMHDDTNQLSKVDDDFFNCPTQKTSLAETINLKTNVHFSGHEEETQQISGLSSGNKTDTSTSNIYEQMTQVPEMNKNDIFNSLTQKVLFSKEIHLKDTVAFTINEEETEQIPKITHNSINSMSKEYVVTQVRALKMEDEDFFNCPTQKVLIPKNANSKAKVSSTIHEDETQQPQPCTMQTASKGGMYEDLTQISKKTNEDFFKCSTQKVSIYENMNSKVPSSIHDIETQLPILSNSKSKDETSTSKLKTCATSNNGKLSQNLELDVDFFNCPTQKVSICKKINSKVPSIHDIETQLPILSNSKSKDETSTSKLKTHAASINQKLSQNPELIDEDFFNCPTQKVSICKKINSKIPSTIHDKETQILIPSNLKSEDETSSSKLKTCATSINGKLSQNLELDDEDFFNCPTQKVSISKKINSKVPSIHDIETQLPILSNSKSKDETSSSKLKTCATSINGKLSQNPELDDEDFFNCPTQKVSICKKINSKVPSIHDIETQLPILSNSKFKDEISTSKFKTCATSINGKLSPNPELDDDFFNCPTQKVSICKKINSKIPSTIHDKETQILIPSNSKSEDETSTSKLKTRAASINQKLSQNPELIDEDFFNCPTQKVSICKKINSKIASTIHDKETQILIPSNSKFKDETNINKIKTFAVNVNKKSLQNSEVDDENFFNCPTQKLSISEKINLIQGKKTKSPLQSNSKPKEVCTINDEETQYLSEFVLLGKTNEKIFDSSTNKKNLIQVPETSDEDFFNCPTQKLSISKKINLKENGSSTINDGETQKMSKVSELNKTNFSMHNDLTQISKIDDENFFTCPTQKVKNSKNISLNVSSLIHDEESQFSISNKSNNNMDTSKTCSMRILEDLTQILKTNNEDFFDCSSQKVSTSKKISTVEVSSVDKKESQAILRISHLNNADLTISETCATSLNNRHLTSAPEMDSDNFFNCPTQKVSSNTKMSVGIGDQETSIGNINDAETQELSVHSNLINYNSKIKLDSKKKIQTKKNDLDCSTQKSDLTSNKSVNTNEAKNFLVDGGKLLCSESNNISDKTEMLRLNYALRECKSVNQNQTIKPDDKTNICMIRKSTRLDSFAMNKLTVHSSVICNQNKNASKSPKVDKKPTIRVRKDLHSPRSVNKSPKSGSKLVRNIPPTSIRKKIDLSDCSETFSDGENNVKMVSVKQEPLTDDLLECQNKRHSKRMDETIFSPLNVNNVSTNSTSELQLANCKPSTSSCSNDDVSKWKLFWNKKKMASQCKGNDTSTNKVVGKEDRYQTRAITRKENTMDLNRKRKQDCVGVNESNKRMCKNDGKQLLDKSIHGIPEVVVSFSYLRNRHLQEMKQFVDMTGGSVTEDITQCTVLVTDKIRCTMKILSAIARGCPIVDANWLKHSYTVKEFQDVGEFIINDKDAERKYNFRLKESLARAQANRLLDGYTVLVTQSVKPGHKDMKVIITCAGGNYVINWPKTRAQKELIVTCKQDRLRWKPMWDNDKALIIDEDTLVASIIRQKLSI